MSIYARIIPRTRLLRGLDDFVYRVPEELTPRLQKGSFVWVRLRGQRMLGLVWSLTEKQPPFKKISTVEGTVEGIKPLPLTYCDFLEWFAAFTGVSMALALKTCVPDAVLRKKPVTLQTPDAQSVSIPRDVLHNIAPLLKNIDASDFAFYQLPTLAHRWVFYIHLLRKATPTCILFPTFPEAENFFRVLPKDCKINTLFVPETLSKNAHLAAWESVQSQKTKNVVGVKSAVFFPYAEGTRFILDSEESAYHKNFDQNPRYHLKDLLSYIHHAWKSPIAYVSRYPSVETEFLIQKNVIQHFAHPSKPLLPLIIDKAREEKTLRTGDMTFSLEQNMHHALGRGKRCVLFFNRTQQVPRYHCQDCHTPADEKTSPTCAHCGSNNVVRFNRTIDDVEKEVATLFPQKKIGVFTSLTHSSDNADILIMTSYGMEKINWTNVGFLGILSFEHLLFPPTYARNEAAWSLLSQFQTLVESFHIPLWAIQARDPNHPVLLSLANPPSFYKDELVLRKQFSYPPFSESVRFLIQPTTKKTDTLAVRRLLESYGEILPTENDSEIMLRITKPLPKNPWSSLPPEVLVDPRPA